MENKKYPRGDLIFSTWISVEAVTSCDALLTYVMIWTISGEGLLPLDKLVGGISYLYDVGSLW